MNQLFSADAEIPLFLLYDTPGNSYSYFTQISEGSLSDPKLSSNEPSPYLDGWPPKIVNKIFPLFRDFLYFWAFSLNS